MKKLIITIFTAFVFACALSPDMSGQARINTKRLRIADLPTRTVKVVLGGNEMMDSALRNEVSSRWRISPYEFCNAEEYRAIKENTDYYFLLLARSEEKKYKGLLTLTLMRGGKYGAEDPMKRPVEVADLPFSSASFPSGREITFLPAMIDIIQDFASKAAISDRAGYGGFGIYAGRVKESGHKRIMFCDDDLTPDMGEAFLAKYFDDDMVIADEKTVDKEFIKGAYNTLVSYTVCPFDPEAGSYCYKMLIDAETHELYYFKHHRLKADKWAGFLERDIKKISAPR